MTAEQYLVEWRDADLITAETCAALTAIVRKERFSVFLDVLVSGRPLGWRWRRRELLKEIS